MEGSQWESGLHFGGEKVLSDHWNFFGQNSAFVSSRLPNSPSVTVSSTPAGTDTDARARGATLAQTHVNARAPSAIQLSGLELWQSS